MKTKISLIIIIFLSVFYGCNNNRQERNLSSLLHTKESEAWGLYSKYDNFRFSGIYYKFYPDGYYDKFHSSRTGLRLFNNDGDLVSEKEFRKWSISKDSILYWYGHKYRVILIEQNIVLLSYGEGTDMFLIKEKADNLRAPDHKYENSISDEK